MKGLVLGYDLAPPEISTPPHVRTRIADVHELTVDEIQRDLASARGTESAEAELKFDAVLSDMAPKTTGIRDADQARSIGLVEAAFAFAEALLKPEGAFVAKVFQGRGFDELKKALHARFFEVRVLKPEATRKGSRECFLIARRLKPIEQD